MPKVRTTLTIDEEVLRAVRHLLGPGDRFPILTPRAFLDTLRTAESP